MVLGSRLGSAVRWPRGDFERLIRAGMGIHYRGVQWEGGAADVGSII